MSLKDKVEKRKKNFMLDSHAEELANNTKIIIKREGKGKVDLILEPDKLWDLSNECRLTVEEYVDAIDEFLNNEEDSWGDLRMKDQMDCTNDVILKNTMLKYAKSEYGIDPTNFDAVSVSYVPRFNESNELLGNQVTVTLSNI